jgi:hypothetical protein
VKKICPVCAEDYTESQKRTAKAGEYRAFRHFKAGAVTWCKSEPGKHLAMMITRAA